MTRQLYRIYESLKGFFSWRAKAAAKGFFLDVFFYRKAAAYALAHPPRSQNETTVRKGEIRVMFVSPHLVVGGAERILFDVINGLSKSGIPTAVCCAVKTGNWVKKFEEITDVCDLSVSAGLWNQKDALIAASKRFGSTMIQLSNCEILYFALPYLKTETGAATINWIHIDQNYFDLLHKRGYSRFSRFIDKTVVTTNTMKEFLVKNSRAPLEKIAVVPNGVDLDFFDPAKFCGHRRRIENKYGIPEGRKAVIFISRLVKEKNPLLFINIAERIGALCPESVFLVVGNGYLRNAMVKLAKKTKMAGRIKFLGFQNAIPEILACASVFVSTSATEGFGLSAAEAMAMKIPVVLSEGGASFELTSSLGGYRVKTGDLDGFVEKIAFLLANDAARLDMGLRARRRIEAEYRISRTVNGFVSIYRELAGCAPQ
jgi:glycosyltransferase involved in cell wall biosynthesis